MEYSNDITSGQLEGAFSSEGVSKNSFKDSLQEDSVLHYLPQESSVSKENPASTETKLDQNEVRHESVCKEGESLNLSKIEQSSALYYTVYEDPVRDIKILADPKELLGEVSKDQYKLMTYDLKTDVKPARYWTQFVSRFLVYTGARLLSGGLCLLILGSAVGSYAKAFSELLNGN